MSFFICGFASAIIVVGGTCLSDWLFANTVASAVYRQRPAVQWLIAVLWYGGALVFFLACTWVTIQAVPGLN